MMRCDLGMAALRDLHPRARMRPTGGLAQITLMTSSTIGGSVKGRPYEFAGLSASSRHQHCRGGNDPHPHCRAEALTATDPCLSSGKVCVRSRHAGMCLHYAQPCRVLDALSAPCLQL